MTETRTDDEPRFEDLPDARDADRIPAAGDRAPGHGAFAPGLAGRVGLAIGRRLPANRTGLKLAGIARPLALAGLTGGVADVEALGLKLRLHPKDNLSEKRLFMTPQCFDPEELAALGEVMGPGKVFIDIGANAGAYALFAAKAGGPRSRVIAVEPQREMRARMRFNAEANALSNLEISGVALSDYEGESVMRLVGENKGRAALETGAGGAGEAVRVTTLKTLLDEHGVEALDAMKIDVEGGEARILSAYFRDVAHAAWPGLIVMERPAVNALSTAEDAVALACAKGYRVARETRMNAILRL
ncbi:FkbM family methyltransferase [Marinicauda algicola]|uniref:FkbM family methyltransferase n=1 Tax=Marinicauda algicola TaxID=2029849 RepID=A0A4S2GZJ4_9PROT|nr:FkbM family methyltransferase [Marinicauda algicola]TGY88252.1 FkbM family methyltransferase [Marinicauda algicola]